MEELIKLDAYPIRGLVRRLLQDKTTRKNIMFASDSYTDYGAGYRDNSQMTEGVLLGFDSCDIQPRVYKAAAEQTERTRKRAEVFTPAWIVNQMNNHCDAEWFGHPDVFNKQDGQSWEINTEPILFPEGKDWKQYVDSRRLEITCGEAPYIASRYDAATGEIIPLERRIGILDRKLRIVNENATDEDEWFKWAFRAFQSVYGYEYQGDNLLIARMNLLYTLADYIEAKWHRQATQKELEKFLNVICWNLWQMDGLNDTPPYGIPSDEVVQMSLFDDEEETADDEIVYCKTYDWRADISKLFKGLKKRGKGMKFDFVIGNPPYQEETEGTSDSPVYNYFMDASYTIGDKVELITPARFLFNAGKTPKAWNDKMLNDEHLSVLFFEEKSMDVFAGTKIRGGVCITYHDNSKSFGAIKVFSPFSEMNAILKKVMDKTSFTPISDIMFLQNRLNLPALYEDHPEYRNVIGSQGKERRFESGIFEKLSIFTENRISDNQIKVYGVVKKKRVFRFFPLKYTEIGHPNINKYKTVIMKSNGEGIFGEVIAAADVLEPGVGYTQSYIGIGAFDSRYEANNCKKYLMTKFLRALLDVKKVTQDNPPDTWACVPLQDFTENSDIDWSKPIADIDQQLYKKYGLTPDEVKFIETHVKEME